MNSPLSDAQMPELREQFETWLQSLGYDRSTHWFRRLGDGYQTASVDLQWSAWKASRSAFLAGSAEASKKMSLAERVLSMSQSELNAADARIVAQAIRDAQTRLEKETGHGHNYMGPYIQLAEDMARRWEDATTSTRSGAVENALSACKTVCDRVIEQYGGVAAGVDFYALSLAVDAAIATPIPADSDRSGATEEGCECANCANGMGACQRATPDRSVGEAPSRLADRLQRVHNKIGSLVVQDELRDIIADLRAADRSARGGVPVAEVMLLDERVGFGRTEKRKSVVFLAEVAVGTKLYAAPSAATGEQK